MDACLIAVGWQDPIFWFAILEVVIGLGFIIFVHELGHFAVAKFCGVKCEKFFLGFDFFGLKLWSYRYGETLYGIGVFPLGGYVKMLGQEDNPARLREEIERAKQAEAAGLPLDQVPPGGDSSPAETLAAAYDPRSYLAKSVPARMAIISAGVIMNWIFAFVLATIALLCGVRRETSIVGAVAAGSGAWQAGLEAGDKIIKVDGEEVQSYNELVQAVITSNGQSIQVVVDRPGAQEPLPFTIHPQDTHGKPTIGVGACQDTKLRSNDDGLPFLPGTPAANAQPGFAAEDRIIKVDDTPIETYPQLEQYLTQHVDKPIVFTVKRQESGHGDSTKGAEVSIRVASRHRVHLGITMEMGEVAAVREHSAAARADIHPGDILRKIDGKPIEDPITFPMRLHDLAGKEVVIVVEREGKLIELKKTALDPFGMDSPSLDTNAPLAAAELGVAYFVANRVASVDPKGPAAKCGLAPGDLVLEATLNPPPAKEMEALREKFALSNVETQSEGTLALGEKQRSWPVILDNLQLLYVGTTVDLEWKHGDDKKKATIEPAPSGLFSTRRGLEFQILTAVYRAPSFGAAVKGGWRETVNGTLSVYRSLRSFGSGKISLRHLGGPWTIVRAALFQAMQGPGNLFLFLTLLSANLAVVNFLPIPVLDGGHFVLLLYEGIRGKAPDERVLEVLTYIGLLFILTLMLFVFGLDFGWIARP